MKPAYIEIPAFRNVHSHLREGDAIMRDLIRFSYQGGADLLGPMPNTSAGLRTAKQVVDYINFAEELRCSTGHPMQFLPIGMLTESTTIAELDAFIKAGIRNLKVYPLDRTTKSESGVRDYNKIFDLVKYGGLHGMIFHFHPEHPLMLFENRDAEWAFISNIDTLLRQTNATIVWEHGTDARNIIFWKEFAKTGRFFVTLTAHHLLLNESNSFGDVRSVCKPSIKTEADRQGLLALVRENHLWVMAGADDAPHPSDKKHVTCGQCACGAFTTPYMLVLYAQALGDLLDTEDGIKTFVNFTNTNATRLHRLAPSTRMVKLVRQPQIIQPSFVVGEWNVESCMAGREIDWSLAA